MVTYTFARKPPTRSALGHSDRQRMDCSSAYSRPPPEYSLSEILSTLYVIIFMKWST
jgi:hypothetical protein